jgi:hypothetical protein
MQRARPSGGARLGADTLGLMGAKPSQIPRSSGRPKASPRAEQGEQHEDRCGTVTIARRVKDDGRALILYTHADDGEP